MKPQFEQRSFKTELRADGTGRTISGTAITYNSASEDLGGFIEQVAPGALTKTLRNNQVKLLFNHDPAYVLGSVEAGTLTLTDTATGLQFSCDGPETTWANDLMVSLRRGDIRQCSFGFNVISDKWEQVNGVVIRTLLEIDLQEISIVAFPAYSATSVSVRSVEQFRNAVDALQADQTSDQQTQLDAERVQQKLNMMLRRLDLASKQ